MAKTKFSINKEKLVEEQGDDYILTRVPNSNMDYYLLFTEDEVLTDDAKTLILEWDSEKELNVLPRVQDEKAQGGTRRPTLKEAIAARQNPTGAIKIKASELYKEYYYYDKTKDPEQREKERQEREAKRKEALERSDNAKNKQNTQESNETNNQKSTQQTQKTDNVETQKSISPAEKIEQQRAQIQYYSKQQFKEILKGSKQQINTSLYRNINLNPQQMRELRLALKAGLDVKQYNSPFISAKHMKEIRLGAKKGVRLDMQKLDHSLYNAEQMHELRLGFEKKVDVKRYLDPAYNAAQMKEIRLGMQAELDTGKFEDLHMTAAQMHAIRLHMVTQKAENILKIMFEDIRFFLNEKIEGITEMMRARYQRRGAMTKEQIKEARMDDAIKDTKELLIQSELLPESAYENEGLTEEMKQSVKDWQEYLEQHPEKAVKEATEEAAKEAVKEICETAEVDLEQPKEEKVIDIQRDKGNEKTIEQAVDEAMQGQEGVKEVCKTTENGLQQAKEKKVTDVQQNKIEQAVDDIIQQQQEMGIVEERFEMEM